MQKLQLPIGVFNVGSIIYVDYPFEDDSAKSKRRPAVVIDYNDDSTKVIVLKLTSQKSRTKYDYELLNPDVADLSIGTKVRCNHVLNLDNDFKCELYSVLSRQDMINVQILYNTAVNNSDIEAAET
jgi:mRNA-degrading endonuclease toxin of MazEF toxin-antitoxin module